MSPTISACGEPDFEQVFLDVSRVDLFGKQRSSHNVSRSTVAAIQLHSCDASSPPTLTNVGTISLWCLVDLFGSKRRHGVLFRWEPVNGTPGLMSLYLRAMDAMHAAVPDLTFLIEVAAPLQLRVLGPLWRPRLCDPPATHGQACAWLPSRICIRTASIRGLRPSITSVGSGRLLIVFAMGFQGGGQQALGANWGDGFAADPALVARLRLSDPRPFFDALATKPYADQVGPRSGQRFKTRWVQDVNLSHSLWCRGRRVCCISAHQAGANRKFLPLSETTFPTAIDGQAHSHVDGIWPSQWHCDVRSGPVRPSMKVPESWQQKCPQQPSTAIEA